MTINDNWWMTSGYTCFQCGQWVTSNGHVCINTWPSTYTKIYTTPQTLEVTTPKYEKHALECGCEVETVVTKHCGTLHKAPREEE